MAVATDIISRLDTGQKVSGVAHIALIAWVMLFDLFQAPDTASSIPVTDVALISSEEFAALSAPASAPPPPAPEPEPQPQPEIAAPAPIVPQPTPEPAPEPAPPPPTPEPTPEPATQPEPEPAAPSTGVIFSPQTTPGASQRPRPRPVDRVAPVPTEAPPEDAQTDLAAQPATTPDPGEEQSAPVEEQPETAPPEATTEIVTEATETDDSSTERAAAAPNISQRPRPRPDRPTPAPEPEPAQTATAPAPTPEPTPTPAPQPDPEPADAPADAINDALAAALAESAAPSAPVSAGLSASQADALRLAIQQCWNIVSLSTEALQVTVTVGFSMTPSAMPEQGTIRVVGASGGSEAAVNQAFEVARRAIIRCAGDGYGLPTEQYDAWRDIEITFNPEGMRLR